MPQFSLKDNQTGKTVVVTGDKPPTQQQAEGIFQKAGLRKPPAAGGMIPSIMGTAGSVLGGVGGAFVPGAGETGLSEVGGSMAGGAVGQGLGEFVQSLFDHKPVDPKAIGAEAAKGGLFGIVPGGAEDNLAIRLLSRFGTGMLSSAGAQIIDDLSKGKKIDHNEAINTLLSSGATGGLTALAPEALQKLSKFAFGDAKQLEQQLARSFVSADHASNPEVTKNLDYSSWQKTVSNLKSSMEQAYKPLQDALSKQTANLGSFLETVRTGLNQSTLHQDVIDRNMSEIVKQIGRQSSGELKTLADEYMRMDKMVSKYPMTRGAAGAAARNAFARKQGILEQMSQMDVPMNLLNEAKKSLGESGIYKDAQGAYFAAKKFIEDNVKGTDVKGINKTYNDLKDASSIVEKRFGNATRDVQTGEPYSWTMRAGLTSALSLIPALLGITGHGATSLISGIPLAAYFGKQYAMQQPERATKYIAGVSGIEKTLPGITSQIMARLEPIIKQIMEKTTGGQQIPKDQTAIPQGGGL